jgi:hypothetical protein
MLSLPQKPWRRARITALGEGRHLMTFVAGVANRAAFDAALREDVEACLGPADRILAEDPGALAVTLELRDLQAFQRALALQSILVERSA